jgi:hypothetical protein
MNQCVLVLYLDAFRPDYLAHTRFLKHLAVSGAHGRLVEPFGFSALAAYFGGLSPGDVGYSHLYWYDPGNSPFSVAKYLPKSGGGAHVDAFLRAELNRHSGARLSDYAATYANAASIPLEYVHYFDVPETRAPFDPAVGFDSIFAMMDRKGMPWYGMFWPLTNRLPERTDEKILGAAIADLKQEHRFALVHLSALDTIGHEYGPSSSEIVAAVQKIDRQAEAMVSHCRLLYDQVDIVIFGDHGMVDVVNTFDLGREIGKHGLQYGNDYVAFYDSSMARFWCSNRAVEKKLANVLQGMEGGRLLTDEDKVAWNIATCDPRNGQFYFLCHPGTVIFPNFFQSEGAMVKGMHGYAPNVADNKGIFILSDGKSKGLVNDVDATQLFHTFVDLLGLAEADHANGLSARSQVVPSPSDRGRFTHILSREQEAVIDRHLATICQELNTLDPRRDAIVLTGGFGRGEGSVSTDKGTIVPLNDYDVLLVTNTPIERSTLQSLGKKLARQIGIDYVDLGVVATESLPNWAWTQLVHDIKYGSVVLDGDPSILDRIPSLGARAIPVTEAARLFFNRLAGAMNALQDYESTDSLSPDAARLLAFQMSKMWIAVGDALLMLHGGYDASYAKRRDRFADLHMSVGISRRVADVIRSAYDFKLGLNNAIAETLDEVVLLLVEQLHSLLVHVLHKSYQIRFDADLSIDALLNTWIGQARLDTDRSMRKLWAAVAMLILSRQVNDRDACLQRAAHWLECTGDKSYTKLRRVAWETWERLCH